MHPLTPLILSGIILAGCTFGVIAQDEPRRSVDQVCQARASEMEVTPDLRETYMRECLAGERLVRSEAQRK